MFIVWFMAGGILGGFNVMMYLWTVNHLHPRKSDQAFLWMAGGAVLRRILIMASLIMALSQGVTTAIFLLSGLGLVGSAMLVWLTYTDNNWVAGD